MTTTVTPPPLLLQATMSSPSIVSTYTDISNPYHGKPSTWSVHLNVIPKSTGYSGSNTPYAYNALDVSVGDWIAGSGLGGRANQIISIVGSVTATSLTAIVNDPGCYNASLDTTHNGNGLGSTGTVYIFQISSTGMPILTTETTNIFDPVFGTDLMGRFLSSATLGGSSGSTSGSLSISTRGTITPSITTLNFGSGLDVSITGSTANITSGVTSLTASIQMQWISGAYVTNGNLYFSYKTPYAGEINSIDYFTSNGSFSLDVKINGVDVPGLSSINVASSTPTTASATGTVVVGTISTTNVFSKGNSISGIISNTSLLPTNTMLNLNLTWIKS